MPRSQDMTRRTGVASGLWQAPMSVMRLETFDVSIVLWSPRMTGRPGTEDADGAGIPDSTAS